MTAFQHGSAPVLSETAGEARQGGKKRFEEQVERAEHAVDPSRWTTTAKSGLADPDRRAYHSNGTRKLSSKRIIQPLVVQAAQNSRWMQPGQPLVSHQVDRRIASFGAFSGFAPTH